MVVVIGTHDNSTLVYNIKQKVRNTTPDLFVLRLSLYNYLLRKDHFYFF